jgi:hypothetical protein
VTPRAVGVLPHLRTLRDALLRKFDRLPCDLFRSFELGDLQLLLDAMPGEGVDTADEESTSLAV